MSNFQTLAEAGKNLSEARVERAYVPELVLKIDATEKTSL